MKKQIKNVFIVPNPMVLLNAIEALHYFNLDSEECLLILPLQTNLLERFLRVARMLDMQMWPNVKLLPFDAESKLSKMALSVKMRNIARSQKVIEKVFFFSTYRQYCRIFLGNCNIGERILIDDGISTLMICRERREGELPRPSIKSKLVATLTGALQLNDCHKISIFTGLDVKSAKDDLVVRNEYTHLRQKMSGDSQCVSDEVYFYGQPLVECAYVPLQLYCDWIEAIVEVYGVEQFKYVPHPIETEENINFLVAQLGLEVLPFDLPPELYFTQDSVKRPKCLASFVSSMLFNCAQIYGEAFRYQSFKINTDTLNCKESLRNHYKSTFEALALNPRIEMLDLLMEKEDIEPQANN